MCLMVQNEYRLDKDELLDNLRAWNRVLRRKVQLIACGGTAMTLLGVKASTKDVAWCQTLGNTTT